MKSKLNNFNIFITYYIKFWMVTLLYLYHCHFGYFFPYFYQLFHALVSQVLSVYPKNYNILNTV